MSEPIKNVIEAIDKNIKGLEDVKEVNLTDVRILLIDLYGIIKDLWDKLQDVFKCTEEIKKIEKATEKGEEYEVKISEDAERVYL